MVLIGLVAICVGAVLTLFLRVWALVPTTLLASAGVAVMELASRHNLASALLTCGISACVLQFGYLIGLFVRPNGT